MTARSTAAPSSPGLWRGNARTVLVNCGIGRARHSVRAVVVKQPAWIGNGGGQRTARPTRRCHKVKFNSHSVGFVL